MSQRYSFGGWTDPRGVFGTKPPRYIKRRRLGYRYEIVDTTKDGAEAVLKRGLTSTEADVWLRLLKED